MEENKDIQDVLENEEMFSFRRIYIEFLREYLGEEYDEIDLENKYKNSTKHLKLLRNVTDIFQQRYYDEAKKKIFIPKSERENVIALLRLLCAKSSLRKGLQEVQKDKTIMKGELNHYIKSLLKCLENKVDKDVFRKISTYN